VCGCWAKDVQMIGYRFYYVYDSVVFLCIVRDMSGTGIMYGWYFYGDRNVLSACVGYNVGSYGFAFYGDDNVAVGCRFYGGSYGAILNGNRNSVNGVSGKGGNMYGLYVNGHNDGVISGCVFDGYSQDGIFVNNSDRNVIANCRCLNNGGYGIKVSDAASEKH
jgi:parallel beta-helix repeat protein